MNGSLNDASSGDIAEQTIVQPIGIDTLFTSGDTILMLQRIDERSGLFSWGIAGHYLNYGTDTIGVDPYNAGQFSLKGRYFLFKDGCGTGCKYTYLMKLKPDAEAQLLLYPVLEIPEKDFFVYQGGQEHPFLHLIDYRNGMRSISFDRSFSKTEVPYTNAIDTIAYIPNTDQVYISWRDSLNQITTELISR